MFIVSNNSCHLILHFWLLLGRYVETIATLPDIFKLHVLTIVGGITFAKARPQVPAMSSGIATEFKLSFDPTEYGEGTVWRVTCGPCVAANTKSSVSSSLEIVATMEYLPKQRFVIDHWRLAHPGRRQNSGDLEAVVVKEVKKGEGK
ncbi:hypothetical protein B0J14DRAFT_217019 [Halenospora varia]|nr:hypothetical protein B0J14DRAFT_217019 [Halenospora varia]